MSETPEAKTAVEQIADSIFERVRGQLASSDRTPLATYRLQLNRDFTFQRAEALVPYLARLGISDLHASPYLCALPGSLHGYDVVDHQSINPEIGAPEDHQRFCRALQERQLGQIVDVVPNHMGIGKHNKLWQDLLENGPSSVSAKFFDVDWDPVKVELKNKVLLPLLGDQYGAVLERGELKLSFREGSLEIHYFDETFPVAPRLYGSILGHRLQALQNVLGKDHPSLVEMQSILTAIEHLPSRMEQNAAKIVERYREKEVIKRRLAALSAQSPEVRRYIQDNVTAINGIVGQPDSFDAIDELLSRCSYRLAHWRVAGEEINYRRFFDINSLAAIRVEDPEVFDEAHALIFRWVSEGKVTGLRIDHPDGLFDPTAYFLKLQQRYFLERARQRPEYFGLTPAMQASAEQRILERWAMESQRNPDSPILRALYVVIEKIQGGRERIPESWAVHGTTGYRFANAVTGLFVERDHERELSRIYERFVGETFDFSGLLYQKKKQIMNMSMSSEINVLARELNRVSEMNRHSRDFTLGSLRHALVEFIALFPVYRTYVDERDIDERDIHYIEWTIRRAKEMDPTINASIYDFLGDILLRRYAVHVTAPQRAVMLRFTMKLQQLTGPVMAKGLEDTVYYVYNRFIALNEVGGEPDRFGIAVPSFHLRNQERAEKWPAALLASSTHDTKRGEDARARLDVISEIPAAWHKRVLRWARMNAKFKSVMPNRSLPDANDEYLYYQALVGAWPMGSTVGGEEWKTFADRMREYMIKAIREAKVHTSWVNPETEYEAAVARFVEQTLSPSHRRFLEDAAEFKRRIEWPGQINSLAQLVLKLASPGTPDIYQGTELWDLSLVDPDNRRPVDFERRQRMLEELDRSIESNRPKLCRELLREPTDGKVKLFVLSQGLRLRQRNLAVFKNGAYLPLDLVGPRAKHGVAFARVHQRRWSLAVVPRLISQLVSPWVWDASLFERTRVQLPEDAKGLQFKNAFTDEIISPTLFEGGLGLELTQLWKEFPVSLLEV